MGCTAFFKSSEFFSAIIGGIFVLLGTMAAYYFQKKQSQNESEERLRNFLKATSVELKSLIDKGESIVSFLGHDLENAERPPFFQFKMSEKYFVVFDNNTSLIGHISNEQLRSNIISVYINIKSFVDSMKLYEENHERYYYSFLLPIETESNKIIQKAANKTNEKILKDSSYFLIAAYQSRKDEVENLINLINSFLKG